MPSGMKAVVYHADSHREWQENPGDLYKALFASFRVHCHKFGIQLIHLTLDGFPGWGDENISYSGYNPHDIVYNRELIFAKFLEDAPEGVYWFTETDYRIQQMWPELKADAAFLYRPGDSVPMTPSWRMATKRALPIFQELAERIQKVEITPYTGRPGWVGRDWHCDSEAFNGLYKDMGKPGLGVHEYKGVSFEMREYQDYVKSRCKYGRHYLARQKGDLA